MNREIKFRAWDTRQKTMLRDVSTGTVRVWSGGVEALAEDCKFMQYTGLKDKNGKEIYEGDIVKIHNYTNKFKRGVPDFDWRVFEVEWNQTNYAFNNAVIYCPFSRYNRETLEDYDIEIIGNIYENPELLIIK
jgi:hypothetical protein